MKKIYEKKKLKKESILIAAQQEFLLRGFALANMDKISEFAQVTKQTVYRYFPSKISLFKEVLIYMGEKTHQKHFEYLLLEDTEEALKQFAIGFINAHLKDDHIATYRLLVAECINEPEIINYFFEQGSDDTEEKLCNFFLNRLKIKEPKKMIELWTAMLLSIRHNALFGRSKPLINEVENHAIECNRWLFASLK